MVLEKTRATDLDREAAASRLHAAVGDGRLDLHEYDKRIQQVYASITHAELRLLLNDFTGSRRHHWLFKLWMTYFLATGASTLGWALVSILQGSIVTYWPMVVAVPVGVILIAVTVVKHLITEFRRAA